MKFFKLGILAALMLTLLFSSTVSVFGSTDNLTTWLLPNATVASNLQLGGTVVWLKVNSTAGIDVTGGSNATNMSFYYANSSGTLVLIGTNMSGSPVTVQNRTWSIAWDTTSVQDKWGPYTLTARATNSTSGVVGSASIGSVEIDNTVPTVSVTNAVGTKVSRSQTITCSATNTRTFTRMEFSTNGATGAYASTFSSSTIPAVTYSDPTATFQPSLGKPTEGVVYARCVASDGTNSTTSAAKQLIIEQTDQSQTDVAGQVGVGVGTGQIPTDGNKISPLMMMAGVAVLGWVVLQFMGNNK